MQTDDAALTERVLEVAKVLCSEGLRLATAESCTGGWIAKCLTDVAGSSEWFEAGVVSYSNLSKSALAGVDLDLIRDHGAVSQPVVEAMARGVVDATGADVGVSVSGVAGPDGGSDDEPVGTVWIAWSVAGEVHSGRFFFEGDREAIRRGSIAAALDGLVERLTG